MNIKFEENEFTTQELLCFLRSAYVIQINGKPFTGAVIRNWIEIKHFPLAYGGYQIVSNILYKQYGNMRVLTLEGITRKEMIEMAGSQDGNNKLQAVSLTKPRKQRTKLYYQILQSAGKQYTKKKLSVSTLPLYWKEAGIKKNQLVNKGKSKAHLGSKKICSID